ncbi:MAG: YlmC/YmxH family sporulation protein [Clostridia bacterium]|nr:YlmC/YmxH family sporulation protein [Clostridia bacterium]
MHCTVEDLCQKEVVDVETARKLGYVCDVELDAEAGSLLCLCVSCPAGAFRAAPRIKIHWRDIVKVGDQTILVRNVPPIPEKQRSRRFPVRFPGGAA